MAENHKWVRIDEKLTVDFNRKVGSSRRSGPFFGNYRPSKTEDIIPVTVHIFETKHNYASLQQEIANLKKL